MNIIITMNELYGLTDQELGELHQLLMLLLAEADPDTQEHRNTLASLKNVKHALATAIGQIRPGRFPMKR